MKKLSLFAFAFAAALVITGCSDENGAIAETGTAFVGDGYMSVTINLPTSASTRAVTYDEGSDVEYEVKKATLLLFGGTDEATATCQGTYELGDLDWQDGGTQVTSTATAVAKVNAPTGAKYYMMVVLNDPGDLVEDKIAGKSFSALTTEAQSLDVATYTGSNGFLMLNSPINAYPGGTSTQPTVSVQTLVPFTLNDIKSSADEAIANPAGSIYVERAMSKVTVNASSSSGSISESTITNAKYEITGWTLDNTNTETYLVRNVADLSTWAPYNVGTVPFYRFVENSAIDGDAGYRINFATDPNYTTDCTGASDPLNKLAAIPSTLTPADATPIYCWENTFDVEHMRWQNTTSAIVAAQLSFEGVTAGTTFYVINNDDSQVYTEAGAAAYAANKWADYFSTNASTYITSGSITDITATIENTAGYAKVTGVSYTEDSVVYASPYDQSSVQAAAVDYLNKLISDGTLTLACYENGISYYSVRIKHFGDYETPWDDSIANLGVSYPDTDGKAENNWLGRYGMVRNTWYDIDVTGVKQIGCPTVPDIDVTNFDDDVPCYLAFTINILDWAKRSQSTTLE